MSVRVRPLAQLDFSRREKPHFTGAFFIDLCSKIMGGIWIGDQMGTNWEPAQEWFFVCVMMGRF